MTAIHSGFREAFWLITKYMLFVYLTCIGVAFIDSVDEAMSIAVSMLIVHLMLLALLANARFRRFFFYLRGLKFDPLAKESDLNKDSR